MTDSIKSDDHHSPNDVVLDVRNLRTHFRTGSGTVRAVDGISFQLRQGRKMGVVGESGSGKSVAALSIMRLIEEPGFIEGGEILLRGQDLVLMSEAEVRKMRGQKLCLVFQDPMSALNPVHKVGKQVVEQILAHHPITRAQAQSRVVDLFRQVGIPDPELRVGEFPHNLSGGMRQRVLIAMALANEPDLLILDEPTTALDVTIQAQILDLVNELADTTVLMISHDIGVIQEICEDVVVMYAGRIMEMGPIKQVTQYPKHPYTEGLLASIPSAVRRGERLHAIEGIVPSPFDMPPGCPFAPRCPRASDVCNEMPTLRPLQDARQVACWMVSENGV